MRSSVRIVALLVVLSACSGCPAPGPQPSPPVGPPAPSLPSDYTVYEELVLAGCLQASDGGEQAVAEQHLSDRQQPWLACLYAGGTVSSCDVPCPK